MSESVNQRHRHLSSSDYRVAIICPLEVEGIPMYASLDEEHPSVYFRTGGNFYKLGRIGQHNVVIASLPETGNNSSAAVITQLVNDFQQLRFGLLVGVGGGICDEQSILDDDNLVDSEDEDYEDTEIADIRLGDIVVGMPTKTLGGVVQFDRGQVQPDGRFERAGSLNKPPILLMNAVNALKIEHGLGRSKITQHMEDILDQNAQLRRRFRYPGADKDQLFESDYIHPTQNKNCASCDQSKTIKRRPRSNPKPRVHYGTIGSANIVVKDSKFRNQLRQRWGLLCVEMEAAGLVDTLPGLVIRGICDYADSHKNNRWQAYAAAAAAAYAKELLLHMTPDHYEHSEPLSPSMFSTIHENVAENLQVTRTIEQQINDAQFDAILERLAPTDVRFSRAQDDARLRHVNGTGQWLLENDDYVQWRDRDGGLFWAHGPAGCGKTVLCSTVIHDLQRKSREKCSKRLAYWYFQFGDAKTQNLDNVVSSLLRQLLPSPLSPEIIQLWKIHAIPGSSPTRKELITILTQVINMLDQVKIVFDALDELPLMGDGHGRLELFDLVSILLNHGKNKVGIFITSRLERDILESFQSAHINLDVEPFMMEDLAEYVRQAMMQPDLIRWGCEKAKAITSRLLSKKERRFRWAELQIQRFSECITEAELNEALETIPNTLEESYHRALSGVVLKERRGIILRILKWLSVTLQPLTIRQLASILQIPFAMDLLKICSSLLITIIQHSETSCVDSDSESGDDNEQPKFDENSIVQLAHFSVKEFLMRELVLSPGCDELFWYLFSSRLAHICVAEDALRMILSPRFQDYCQQSMRYVAEYWTEHLKLADDTNLEAKAEKLFHDNEIQRFNGLIEIYDPDDPYGAYKRRPKPSRLYYASMLGLTSIFKNLWLKSTKWLPDEGRCGNAANAAMIHGHLNIVKVFLHEGLDPSGIDLARVLELIEYAIEPTLNGFLSDTPDLSISGSVLTAAAGNNRHGTVMMQILLDRCLDIDSLPQSVIIAAVSGFSNGKVLKLLLEKYRSLFEITQDVLLAAIANRVHPRMFLKILLGDGTAFVTEQTLSKIASTSCVEKLELALEFSQSLTVNFDMLFTAGLMNHQHGDRIAFFLLEKYGSSIHLDSSSLQSAIQNPKQGQKIVSLLLRYKPLLITAAILQYALTLPDVGTSTIKLLLEKRENIGISTELLLAAVNNPGNGHQTLPLLLDRYFDCVVDEVVVNEAVANQLHSNQLIQAMLDRNLNLEISQHTFLTALTNEMTGIDTTRLLIREKKSVLKIINAMLESAPSVLAVKLMDCLLDVLSDDNFLRMSNDDIHLLQINREDALFKIIATCELPRLEKILSARHDIAYLSEGMLLGAATADNNREARLDLLLRHTTLHNYLMIGRVLGPVIKNISGKFLVELIEASPDPDTYFCWALDSMIKAPTNPKTVEELLVRYRLKDPLIFPRPISIVTLRPIIEAQDRLATVATLLEAAKRENVQSFTSFNILFEKSQWSDFDSERFLDGYAIAIRFKKLDWASVHKHSHANTPLMSLLCGCSDGYPVSSKFGDYILKLLHNIEQDPLCEAMVAETNPKLRKQRVFEPSNVQIRILKVTSVTFGFYQHVVLPQLLVDRSTWYIKWILQWFPQLRIDNPLLLLTLKSGCLGRELFNVMLPRLDYTVSAEAILIAAGNPRIENSIVEDLFTHLSQTSELTITKSNIGWAQAERAGTYIVKLLDRPNVRIESDAAHLVREKWGLEV